MITRVGKIARLPHSIRDELNQRLFNGALGPELAKWLNALPEVQEILATSFAGSPINRQNLTEWRQGGYQDWLVHQERELRIQRINEENAGLKQHENKGNEDLFENSARIALAELMADMDTLHQLQGDDRLKRLRTLIGELSHLQNAYNRSRRTGLAWVKWNERFCGPDDYDYDEEKSPTAYHPAISPPPSLISPATPPLETPNPTPSPALATAENPEKTPEIKPDQTTSTSEENSTYPVAQTEPLDRHEARDSVSLSSPKGGEGGGEEAVRAHGEVMLGARGEVDDRIYLNRPIYHPKDCSCICHNCHPETGDYPYAEALRDSTEAQQCGVRAFWRGRTSIHTIPTECNCVCKECKPAKPPVALPPPISSPGPILQIENTPFDPLADFLRQTALLKKLREGNQRAYNFPLDGSAGIRQL